MIAVTRRQFALAGAAGAAAAAGSSSCSASPSEDAPRDGQAYAPWRDWRADAAGNRTLILAAILAANAHDTQPWLFCAADRRIDLFADESRNLGAMDPFRREMHISLGCALENLALAARAQGLRADISVDGGSVAPPAGASGPRHVAAITLVPDSAGASPLFAAIAHRHTNRGPYDPDRLLSADLLAGLEAQAVPDGGARLILLADAGARAAFAQATVAATEAIIADSAMIADSDAWFRASDAEIEKHRDGPTIYAAGLSPFRQFLAALLPAPSPKTAHRYWLEQTRETQLATAPMFGLIAVRDLYDRPQAIAAGRLWQRLHLAGTRLGLGMQPLNQTPERVDRGRQLGRPDDAAKVLAGLVDGSEWRPTFAFRLGWPVRPAAPSPRRALDSVLLPGACAT